MTKTNSTLVQDCKRFAYLYGIELSGNAKTGIAIMCEGYATAFDSWEKVLSALRFWREGMAFRDACMKAETTNQPGPEY